MPLDNSLVIGGSGFLGRNLVLALKEKGAAVSAFDIVQRYDDVPFYPGDITVQSQIEDAIRKSGATCVLHTASPHAGAPAALQYKVNLEGTTAVIAACQSSGVTKLVFTSSAGLIFAGEYLANADERVPLPESPMDAYNDSKGKAEKLVLEANGKNGLATVSIRPSGIFGPGDMQMLPSLIKAFQTKKTGIQIGYNENLIDYTYVGNVVHAHLLAAEHLHDPPVSVADLQEPIPPPEKERRIPTSTARPLGPAVVPPPGADNLVRQFNARSGSLPKPIVRSRFDPLSETALERENIEGVSVAGNAFIVTNDEPIYFWDFAHTFWYLLGDTTERRTKLPDWLGYAVGYLMEWKQTITGKEEIFSRNRVLYMCTTRFYNIEKAKRVLKYEPIVGMEEAIRRTVDWWKLEGSKKAK